MKKKYAVCMWGQLRSVNTIKKNLYENLIKPLTADFFVMVQKTGTDIDKNMDLFQTKNKIMYESPDVTKIFKIYSKLIQNNPQHNYMNIPYLNMYYNMYKIGKIFGDTFEKNYEYIILTRSDYLHLFPFPDISSLYDKKNLFWCYDGHECGGINCTLICIPSKYIKSYLFSFYNYLQDPNNIKILNSISCILTTELNTEFFTKIIFDNNNWKIGKIEPNAFISASNINEITTWAEIQYSKLYEVFYKYEDQLNRAFTSLEKYKNNQRWHLCNSNGNYSIILKN
jgi:hypothetical protein